MTQGIVLHNLDLIDNVIGRLKPEVEAWCRDNRVDFNFIFATYPGRHTVYFEMDEDAVLFKLRWIG